MNRGLELYGGEIFLFRTYSFHENNGILHRGLVNLLKFPFIYGCTSSMIMKEKKGSLGRVISHDLKDLANQVKEIYVEGSENLLVFSKSDFENNYFSEGSHGEIYDISEFGAKKRDCENFRDNLLNAFDGSLEVFVGEHPLWIKN